MLDKLFIFVQPFSIRALTYYSVSTHCKYGSGLLVRKAQAAVKLLLPPTSPHLLLAPPWVQAQQADSKFEEEALRISTFRFQICTQKCLLSTRLNIFQQLTTNAH